MNNANKNKKSNILKDIKISNSVEETEKIGAIFSNCLKNGTIVFLYGDLGVGKSVFARGVIQSLPGGGKLTVRSPTFLYLFEYPTIPVVVHLDLYRMKKKTNLLDLGLEEWIKNKHVLFIEWPQHISDNSIIPNYIVEIKMKDRNIREIIIQKHDV
ncbi:MAG: tRNA (adenosine(37)-N6)-threonylcarbamoyltransferase complex ATPase subunit type 1 TsaE [Nitrospinota bacterium]|nr:tRNA (adenosine(37)-N6)-threonylcarbamoyltransferase complex ATPase subunit type 1 TsaE [Nitrospinota bacterium]